MSARLYDLLIRIQLAVISAILEWDYQRERRRYGIKKDRWE